MLVLKGSRMCTGAGTSTGAERARRQALLGRVGASGSISTMRVEAAYHPVPHASGSISTMRVEAAYHPAPHAAAAMPNRAPTFFDCLSGTQLSPLPAAPPTASVLSVALRCRTEGVHGRGCVWQRVCMAEGVQDRGCIGQRVCS